MIRPESCTKEELIYFIKNSMPYRQDDFDMCISQYRSDKYHDMAEKEHLEATKLLHELAELRSKYDGYRYSDIPAPDLLKLKTISEKVEKHYKQSDKLWKKSLANIK